MGLDFSVLSHNQEAPPKVVLVPPMFERDLKARSRMTKSSYDYLFAKKALKWLFNDYYNADGIRAAIFPHQIMAGDPRTAGNMTLRYQPYGLLEPLTFLDIKVNPKAAGDISVRGCWFSTENGLGTWAIVPAAPHLSKRAAEVGLRYSSPTLTSGVVLSPTTNTLEQLWLAGRYQSFTAGAQLRPQLSLADLQVPNPQQHWCTADYVRSRLSYALAYSPERRTQAGQPAFTAAVEMTEGRTFTASFYQHMSVTRQVLNPLEHKDRVIGITNYIDLGLQLVTQLTDKPDPAAPSGLQMGAAWQVNKNVLVKARGSSDSAALVVAAKSWFHPSLALAVTGQYNFRTGVPHLGFHMQVENFGSLRYERSRVEQVYGQVLTQRHEATDAEVAMAEGLGPLVKKAADDQDFNVAEPASIQFL